MPLGIGELLSIIDPSRKGEEVLKAGDEIGMPHRYTIFDLTVGLIERAVPTSEVKPVVPELPPQPSTPDLPPAAISVENVERIIDDSLSEREVQLARIRQTVTDSFMPFIPKDVSEFTNTDFN